MKKLLLTIIALTTLNAFAQDSKFVVLEYANSLGESAFVKFKITPKMYSERTDPGVAYLCYTNKNNRYWYKLLSTDIFGVMNANDIYDVGQESSAITYKGIDGIRSINSENEELPSGEVKRHYMTIKSEKNHTALHQQGPQETPSINVIPEIQASSVSSPIVINTFSCFKFLKGQVINP